MMKSLCLFNHKGGVSKTTTAFNLGWCLASRGHRVVMVDLDSQCNLTGLVLGYNAVDSDKMKSFYADRALLTMKPVVQRLIDGMAPDRFLESEGGSRLFPAGCDNLFLLPGHLDVSDLDSQISVSLKIASGIPATRNIPGNLPTILTAVAERERAEYVIYDLSPSVGGLNEVILMSSDYFIVPVSPDFFCLQAVGSLKNHFTKWHREIRMFVENNDFNPNTFPIRNAPKFLGAIQQRYRPRYGKPAKSFERWIDTIRDAINSDLVPSLERIDCVVPRESIASVLADSGLSPYDLAHIADFNSLIAISQQLCKPVFVLTDDEIRSEGRTFGHAWETMVASRDNFNATFEKLADRLLHLM